MGLLMSHADFKISKINENAFLKGEKVLEFIPKGLNLKAYEDTIHRNCGEKSFYGLVLEVDQIKGVFYLKKNDSL
jgi:hypothetical protein